MPPPASRPPAAPLPDRRSSARQGRAAVTRAASYHSRSAAGRAAVAAASEATPSANPPRFLPALTHFTAAVDACPQDMVTHFTTWREVKAKTHDSERMLRVLLEDALKAPVPTRAQRRSHECPQDDASGEGSIHGSAHGSNQDAAAPSKLFAVDVARVSPLERADLEKRRMFSRLRGLLAAALPILDEQLVVLSAANTSKSKSLERMKSSYRHIDDEISEEARYGSRKHWAYECNRERRKGTQQERQRREGAAARNVAAAGYAVPDADSIAGRGEPRREAALGHKRGRKSVESDVDDSRPKKSKRKSALPVPDARATGLGITNEPARKKKADRAPAAAPVMELPFGGRSEGPARVSPRATPGAEGRRRGRAAPAPPGRRRCAPRRRSAIPLTWFSALAVPSPPVQPSPLAASFAVAPPASRKSSTSAAAPQLPDSRPFSSHSARPPSRRAGGVAASASALDGVIANTAKEAAETAVSDKSERQAPSSRTLSSKEADAPGAAAATTRGARASKPPTPVASTFSDVPMMRTRSSRNGNDNSTGSLEAASTARASARRTSPSPEASAQAGVSSTSVGLPAAVPTAGRGAQPSPDARSEDSDASSGPRRAAKLVPARPPTVPEGSSPMPTGDEPRYCYCNDVSYGDMVACDRTGCPREWFHLSCLNMDKAPSNRTKWFCSAECKDAYEGKKGMPVSKALIGKAALREGR